MKSNLFDLMAPELRTPLTSIKASVSTLLADSRLEPSLRKDLLLVIAEKANRLNNLVGETLHAWDAEVRGQAVQKSNRRASGFGSTRTTREIRPRAS